MVLNTLDIANKTAEELKKDLQTAMNANNFDEVIKISNQLKEMAAPKAAATPTKTPEELAKEQEELNKQKETNKTQQTTQADTLKNLLNDDTTKTPEALQQDPETIKTRIRQTIDRYLAKLKDLKNANAADKDKTNKELEEIKSELKKEKDKYEAAKNYFLGTLTYTPENISKISTRRIRRFKKTEKDGIVTYSPVERLKFATMKRRMTINALAKKFNDKIGNDPVKGSRFIIGFGYNKTRFLRYTGIKFASGLDKLGSNMGLQMNPEQFHKQFNQGKEAIFSILDKGEKTPEEQKIIDAIKARITYYGYAYARQRASAWTDPFIQAETGSKQGAKIVQMPTSTAQKAAA